MWTEYKKRFAVVGVKLVTGRCRGLGGSSDELANENQEAQDFRRTEGVVVNFSLPLIKLWEPKNSYRSFI